MFMSVLSHIRCFVFVGKTSALRARRRHLGSPVAEDSSVVAQGVVRISAHWSRTVFKASV